MTTADLEKVKNFKKIFQPYSLPNEVLQSGLFVSGSDTSNRQV